MIEAMVNNTANTKSTTQYKSSLNRRQVAREILIRCIRSVTNPEKDAGILEVIGKEPDWDYLITLSDFQSVTPMVAHMLLQDEYSQYVPEPYQERLMRILHDNINKHIILSEELVKILAVLHQSEIEVIALKGSVLAKQLYVNPEIRPISDIDILIREQDIPKTEKIILEAGYNFSNDKHDIKHPFHRVFFKQSQLPIMLEAHWDLDDSRITDFPVTDIWNRSQEREFQHNKLRVLSPEDTLIYLSSNLFRDNGQQLRYVCDITALIIKHKNNINWNYLTNQTRLLGINTQTYYALKWAHEICEAPLPNELIQSMKPPFFRRRLIEFLMNYGTIFAPIQPKKIRLEANALIQSLMMDRIHQSRAVMEKYHGYDKRFVFFRILTWMPLVMAATLWSNVTGVHFDRKLGSLENPKCN